MSISLGYVGGTAEGIDPEALLRVGADEKFSKVGVEKLLPKKREVGKALDRGADALVGEIARLEAASATIRFPERQFDGVRRALARHGGVFGPPSPHSRKASML